MDEHYEGLPAAAAAIGASRSTISNWIRGGRLPAQRGFGRGGGIYRIRKSDLASAAMNSDAFEDAGKRLERQLNYAVELDAREKCDCHSQSEMDELDPRTLELLGLTQAFLREKLDSLPLSELDELDPRSLETLGLTQAFLTRKAKPKRAEEKDADGLSWIARQRLDADTVGRGLLSIRNGDKRGLTRALAAKWEMGVEEVEKILDSPEGSDLMQVFAGKIKDRTGREVLESTGMRTALKRLTVSAARAKGSELADAWNRLADERAHGAADDLEIIRFVGEDFAPPLDEITNPSA